MTLFTYQAYVERVVDGGTLLVQVDLGFGLWTRQYLRQRLQMSKFRRTVLKPCGLST